MILVRVYFLVDFKVGFVVSIVISIILGGAFVNVYGFWFGTVNKLIGIL